MRYIIAALISIALLPLVVQAADNDPAITSIEITSQGSSELGATTNYEFTLTTSETIAADTTITLMNVEIGTSGLPEDGTVLDFSGATFTSDALSYIGETSSLGTSAYKLVLSGDAASDTYIITATDVVNPSTAVCLVPVASTGNVANGDASTGGTTTIAVGSGDCSAAGDGDNSGSDDGFSVTAFGTNIIIEWEPIEGAVSYNLPIDTDNDFENGVLDITVNEVEGTSYVYTGLDTNTEYIIAINGVGSDDEFVLVPYPAEIVTTGKALSKTRSRKPSKVKNIKKKQAQVRWRMAAQNDYLTKHIFQVRNAKNNKIVKSYKKVGSAKLKKVVKGLKSGKKYKVRKKEVYNFDGSVQKTKWSKWKKFTTK